MRGWRPGLVNCAPCGIGLGPGTQSSGGACGARLHQGEVGRTYFPSVSLFQGAEWKSGDLAHGFFWVQGDQTTPVNESIPRSIGKRLQ